jgi:hypothetical protein
MIYIKNWSVYFEFLLNKKCFKKKKKESVNRNNAQLVKAFSMFGKLYANVFEKIINPLKQQLQQLKFWIFIFKCKKV